ncbi:MAG: hypothetical protein ACOC0O_05040 [Spirochaetota bacterium]
MKKLLLVALLARILLAPVYADAGAPEDAGSERSVVTAPLSRGLIAAELPWWGRALLLFVIALGVVAVIGGICGGVLFVPIALVAFVFIGMLAGMFGLGAGWGNVPALNLRPGAEVYVEQSGRELGWGWISQLDSGGTLVVAATGFLAGGR